MIWREWDSRTVQAGTPMTVNVIGAVRSARLPPFASGMEAEWRRRSSRLRALAQQPGAEGGRPLLPRAARTNTVCFGVRGQKSLRSTWTKCSLYVLMKHAERNPSVQGCAHQSQRRSDCPRRGGHQEGTPVLNHGLHARGRSESLGIRAVWNSQQETLGSASSCAGESDARLHDKARLVTDLSRRS